MSRTVVRIGAALAAIAALVALTAIPASAHHVFLEFEATGDLVPGGGGDPEASAAGVIDFNSEESPEVCIEAVADGLDGITDVVIVAKSDQSLLLDFGSLDTCVVATDEEREALHDAAADYLLVIATEQYPEGAVAGELVEQEPTTTTSSTVPEDTTSTTADAAAAAASTSPRFTG
jgi:hypothetical protein